MRQSTPLFSVVIPTYGRAQYLQKVLSGLIAQTEKEFETIVVDNNEIQTFKTHNIPQPGTLFTIVHEPRNGLSYARNAGIVNSRGKYVAFLDDDGVPEEEWLENLAFGMERYHAAMVGGSVKLVLPREAPQWLSPHLRILLSELLYEGEDIPHIGEDLYLVGANMSIARDALIKVGGFSHLFDRTANTLRSSGELEFSKRLKNAGGHISFVASAVVWHHISDHRLSKKYFLSRAYWQGRSDALLEVKWGRPESFGPRDNGKNVAALMRAFFAFVREDACRFEKLLGLVREFAYCFQFAQLSLRPGMFAEDLY